MTNRAIVAVLISLALVSCNRQIASAQQTDPVANSTSAITENPTPKDLPSLAPILAKVTPAVVNISVRGMQRVQSNPMFQDPMFRRFFGVPENTPPERFQAVGSGVIIDDAHGYVITNNHVIRNAQHIQVTLKDRRQFDAKLIGTDPQTDVAVLQIHATHLTALPFGTSKDLKVGDYVIALGDPFGLGQTATFGIVSALGRTGLGIENYEDFIQTDASINPGNSGGALVNMAGQLVGINTAILSGSGGNVGVGFAIPGDMVRTIADELISHGKVSRGELGVVIQDLTPNLAQAMNLKISSGALVSQVVAGSPGAKAGIKSGDVITKLDNMPVANSSELRNNIAIKPPGTKVKLTLLRGDRKLEVTATLQALKNGTTSTSGGNGQESSLLSGVTTGPIPSDDPNYGKIEGVYLQSVDADSAAGMAGLQQGDIITAIDQHPVRSAAELNRLVRAHPPGRPLLLRVRRGNSSLFIAIQ